MTRNKRLKPRKTGVAGHLADGEREQIMTLWETANPKTGTVKAIAEMVGVSNVTVSNVVLRETGMRPRFHYSAGEMDHT